MSREATVAAVRATILEAVPGIAEGVKWNSPSFYVESTGTYFATLNLKTPKGDRQAVLVVLHQGAKKTGGSPEINDPEGLLTWHSAERCTASFANVGEITAKREAFREIVRQWVGQL